MPVSGGAITAGVSLLTAGATLAAQDKAASDISEANKAEATRIAEDKKIAQDKRKKAIDLQREQMGLDTDKFKTLTGSEIGAPSLLEVLG